MSRRLQLPSRAKIDNIGIGLLDARNASSAAKYINLTPGYQFLAVGENAPNEFSLVVDRFGVGVNTPFLDRNDPKNQAALFVDGNVHITGTIMASNLVIYTGTPSTQAHAGGLWGIAMPSMGAYYDDTVVIGNSNAATLCTNALLVTRDSWNNWNNAQVRVDNTAGAQLNMGFVGHGVTSPAIINTPPGVSIEFHTGRTAASINSNYVMNLPMGGVRQLETPLYYSAADPFPNLLIDSSGNIGIHTSVVATYQTAYHSSDVNTGYAITYHNHPAALDVHGTLYASNILLYDYVTNSPLELDKIFFRQSGIIIEASNVGYGDFEKAPYRFPCNIGVIAPIDARFAMNVGGPIAATDLYASDLVKTVSLITASLETSTATVLSDLTINQKLLINGGIFIPVIAQKAIIDQRELQLAFFGSNGKWFDTLGHSVSSNFNTLVAHSVSTFDGLHYAGQSFMNAGGGIWTSGLDVSGIAMVPYEEVNVTHVASNLYTDSCGNNFVSPPVTAWLSSPPTTLDVFLPIVAATLTSNFITTEYTAVNFTPVSSSLTDVNYFSTGMSVVGRFGCGIGVMDSVDNQLVSLKIDPTIFGLEVSDEGDPEKRLKRSLYVGHKNFSNSTNPTDFGATLFVTPSINDYRYFSALVQNPVAVAQHMYFMPGYDFLTKAIETDASLCPALSLLGDGTNFVGINTRTPSATLHVNGDILFTGTLKDGSPSPISFFHEIHTQDPVTGSLFPAVVFQTEINTGVANMAFFTIPDSRYGLSVGTHIKSDGYYTFENNRLGELLVKDYDTVNPSSKGGTLITMNNLGIGTFSPNPVNALEVLSILPQKTVVQVKRNPVASDVSLDLYLSPADVWSLNADSAINPIGGMLTLANIGTNVSISTAMRLAAITSLYNASTGKYHVGINTTNPMYSDGSAPVLLVNGGATITGDINVVGRYLQNGQVVINATCNVNSSRIPSGTTSVTLGPEDVFIGGQHVYLNPNGTLYVGAVETPVVSAPQAALQVIASSIATGSDGSVPLAQFYTNASAGYIEIGAMVSSNATSRVRLEYIAGTNVGGRTLPGTFQIVNLASASFPYISFNYKQFGATAYNNIALNAAAGTPASQTIVQVHDTTGGYDANFNSFLVSCDSVSSGGPTLSLGKVTGSAISSAWTLNGPNAHFNDNFGFSYANGGSTTQVMCLTNSGNLGIGTTRPAFGVDMYGTTMSGATLSATSTMPGVASGVRLATANGFYTWSAHGTDGSMQLMQGSTGASTSSVMQVSSNGNVSFGTDVAPDPKYSINMTGSINIGIGGIFLNGQQLFNVGQNDYVINSRLQYFIPGYGGAAYPMGGTYVGVGSTTITSNLFYVQNRYDGGVAVFESDTFDAHINLYSKPPVGIHPGSMETVVRMGVDNSLMYPMMYFGMRPHISQSDKMFVDPSTTNLEKFLEFVRSPTSSASSIDYLGNIHGSLTVRDTLQCGTVSDGAGALLHNGFVTATAIGIGTNVPVAALHVAAVDADTLPFLITGASNVGFSIRSAGQGLDVIVEESNGGALFSVRGSNAMRIDAGAVSFLAPTTFTVPIASPTMFTNNVAPYSGNVVLMQNLDISGTLTVNGLPFTANFWEFSAGGESYIPGVGGGTVISSGGGTSTGGTTLLNVPLLLGPLPVDVALAASANTPLLLTNAAQCDPLGGPDDPQDVIVITRANSNTSDIIGNIGGSVAASLAVGRWGQASDDVQSLTRLDVRLAGASANNMVSALTLVADANGATMVGVGVVPRFALDVSGDLNVTGSYFQAAENININNTVIITPGQLTLADSNIIINSRYCGIGTATGDPNATSMPIDVYNNVGGTSLARFTTSNPTGVASLCANNGGTSANLPISADGLSVATLGTALVINSSGIEVSSSNLSSFSVNSSGIALCSSNITTFSVSSSGITLCSTSNSSAISMLTNTGAVAWQMLSDSSGSFHVFDNLGEDRLSFDVCGNTSIFGYCFGCNMPFDSSSNASSAGALTLSYGIHGSPFVYFYGNQGGVGIGTAAYPFNVLVDNLAGGYNTVMGGDVTGGITSNTINSSPLRLMVNGAISCTSISSFTGQHLVMFSHPSFKAEYIGLIVSLTGRVVDNNFTVDQSVPIVEFARKRSDPAAYGIMCSGQGGTPYQYICLVNSLGEGGMWVCNVNGDLAIGDYITTSSVAGYGMKQGDDLLHNYTVAKASMNVPFSNLPSWMHSKTFIFKDPFDRMIKNITACLIPVTYHCA